VRTPAMRRIAYSKFSKQSATFITVNVANVVLGLMISQIFRPSLARTTFIVCTALFIAAVFYFFLRIFLDNWKVRYIAFVSEGTRGVAFYEKFFEQLVREAHDHSTNGRFQYVVFPWIADEGKAKVQLQSLRRINHSGMIAVPTDDIDIKSDLAEHKVPVVLFDAIPNEVAIPHGFSCVSGSEREGGREAGRSAVEFLHRVYSPHGPEQPCIWILHGKDFGFMPIHRAKFFAEEVRRSFPQVKILGSERLSFSRDKARVYVYERFEGLENVNETMDSIRKNGEVSRVPDIIFALNDDMALGAREALRQFDEEGRLLQLCAEYGLSFPDKSKRLPQIIGYDGIDEMKDLLRSENERYLLATVDAKVENQAKNAWHAIVRHLEGTEEKIRPVTMELIEKNWFYEPDVEI